MVMLLGNILGTMTNIYWCYFCTTQHTNTLATIKSAIKKSSADIYREAIHQPQCAICVHLSTQTMFLKCFVLCTFLTVITMSVYAEESEEVKETSEDVGTNFNYEGKKSDLINYLLLCCDFRCGFIQEDYPGWLQMSFWR